MSLGVARRSLGVVAGLVHLLGSRLVDSVGGPLFVTLVFLTLKFGGGRRWAEGRLEA